jgi:hypothetical protein
MGKNGKLDKTIFFLGRRIAPMYWGDYYFTNNRSPGRASKIWTLFFFRLTSGLAGWLSGPKKKSAQDAAWLAAKNRIESRFSATSVPTIHHDEFGSAELLPKIRATWLVHPKDFPVLAHSVSGVVQKSLNHVSEILIITPDPNQATALIQKLDLQNVTCRVEHENDFLTNAARKRLRTVFGDEYGTGLQRVVTTTSSLDQSVNGTLVIDADTVLLTSKPWLGPDGRQLMYFRSFIDPSYQRFLETWGMTEIDYARQFVTHHMMLQPKLLDQALNHVFGTSNSDDLVEIICESVLKLKSVYFCLEYEVYAQYVNHYFPQLFEYDKYTNLNMRRPSNPSQLDEIIRGRSRNPLYNSLSFHHYLG